MKFQDKVILITGASSGIGKALALKVAKEGAIVVLIARGKERLDHAVSDVQKLSPKSLGLVCDVANPDSVRAVVHDVRKRFGRIDMLVNNAGVGLYKSVVDTELKEFEDLMKINYFGTVYMTKEVLPHMLKFGGGVIVNVASVSGKTGFPHISAYAASKFAVVGFTESLYYDVRKKGIQVHLICPGAVKTNFFNNESFASFPHEERHKGMLSADVVANAILEAIKTDTFEVFVPELGRYKYIGKNLLRKTYMNKVMKLPR